MTAILQPVPAAMDEPQLLVWLNVPVVKMLLSVSGPSPMFTRVTDCEALEVFTRWLLKLSAPGESCAMATVPVPLRATVSVWEICLLAITNVPVLVKRAVGVNTTPIEQFAPGAKTLEHIVASEKSPVV